MKYLILSGGGAAGSFQAGSISALHRSGYVPDAIYGVSVGALNAAAYALVGPIFVENIWAEVADDPSKFFRSPFFTSRGSFAPLRSLLFPRAWVRLFSRRMKSLAEWPGVEEIVSKLPNPIRETTPTEIVYVDMHTGEPVQVKIGDEGWREAVLASAAYPVVFPPVMTGTGLGFDGGMRVSVPIRYALEKAKSGDEITVISTATAESESPIPPRDFLDTLGISYRIISDDASREELRQPAPAGVSIRIIRPSYYVNPFDFGRYALAASFQEGMNQTEHATDSAPKI